MLSINRLSARQLFVRKGRTLLTGLAIMLGVASLFSLLIVGTSGSILIERQMRSHFGLADLRVYTEATANQKQVARKVAGLSGVEGTAVGKLWVFIGDLNGKRYEFHMHAVDTQSSIAPKLYPISSGHLPRGNKEIALSAEFARDRGYRIGQTFTMPLKTGNRKLQITGFVNDGLRIASMAARTYVDMPFMDKFGSSGDVGSIAVIVRDSSKDDRFIDKLILKIEKLDEVAFAVSANDILADALKQANMLKALFVIVGAISLIVAVTLIYSTFAITAMEREREFGLLKAMGADRRWVRCLVYREAAVMGSIFSLIGIPLGLGLSYVFLWVSIKTGTSTGVSLSDLVILPRDLIISFFAGTGATLFSAFLPARKVGKTHPLSSIRPQPTSEQNVSRVRWVGLALTITGAVALTVFSFSEDPEAIALVGFGSALGIYLGLAIFMPVVIGPLFNVLEKLSLRRIGIPGRLAAKNLSRQSLRSARTVTSILIGISLVFLVAIFSESAISSGHRILKEQVKYDLAITTSEESLSATPKELTDKVKRLEEVWAGYHGWTRLR
ncbi:MAG: ABC transporter permease [Actinobacteria bacterium]|nr:ABC transporter permease [Actinomycetota bacterium]